MTKQERHESSIVRFETTVSMKWWVPAYLNTHRLLAMIFNTEPDQQKVGEFIVKYGTAIKTKAVISQNSAKHPHSGA
ncbi:hypothetical protein KKJ17_14810 [Xenorhabdus bovienii]|uniref:hypothetical protein n=1 Tax=Xenorhabdus bovienii TaxID=40576 RepID=UPI00237C8867|nr:hypothetical protein [Xenorhabdus bovienii]MDE1486090.1 hypothetical protein [Xenorhabdus bovienii]MDE9478827.1 hypothetical protein [Xenorhabdus bovienii]MDE9518963.1 hypothetical protein [Xenorhabdus bovienii]MDE9532966.1 hypothetical protein [Xenorhabdus bovienii]